MEASFMPALYGKDASNGGESPCGCGGIGESYVMEVGRVNDSFFVSFVWFLKIWSSASHFNFRARLR